MIRLKKAAIALTVLISMVFSVMPTVGFANKWEPASEPPEYEEIIYNNPGNTMDGLDGQGTVGTDSEKGSCIVMNTGQLFKYFTEENKAGKTFFNEQGQAMVSFDICAEQTDCAFVVELKTPQGGTTPLFMNGGGKMLGVEIYPDATSTDDKAVEYEANRWYNIKMVIHGKQSYIDIYLDNQYWNRIDRPLSGFFNPDIDPERAKIKSIDFSVRGDWALDSTGAVVGGGTGRFKIANLTYGIPKPAEQEEVSFVKNEIGNIYDAENVNIECGIFNRTSADAKYTLSYDIRTDKNVVVKKGSDVYDVKSGQSRNIQLMKDNYKNGFYIAEVKLYNSKSELISKDTMRFSVVPHQESLNPNMGVGTHTLARADRGDYLQALNLINKLGFSCLRTDASSVVDANYEALQDPQWIKTLQQGYEQYPDIVPLIITGDYSAGAISQYSRTDPEYPQALENYKKYVRTLAEKIGPGKKYYDIENEWYLRKKANGEASDIEVFADAIMASSEVIREVNPDAVITVDMGDMEGWTDKVVEELNKYGGAKKYIDVINFHTYMAFHVALWPEQYLEYGNQSDSAPATHKKGYVSSFKLWEDAGLGDIPVWATEYGHTTGYQYNNVDEKRKADYYVRQTFLLDRYGVDIKYPFKLERRDITNSPYEAGFGIVNQGAKGEIWFEAYPSAIEVATYTKLSNGAEYQDRQIIDDDDSAVSSDDMYIYKYKMQDGKDLYVIYNVEASKICSLDLGVNSAKVYDEYGNENTLSAVDGYITLNITEAPTYVVADNMAENVTVRETPIFNMDQSVKTAKEDGFEFKITKDTSLTPSVSVVQTANTEVTKNDGFIGSTATVGVTTYSDTLDVEAYKFYNGENREDMTINISSGNKLYYSAPLTVDYVDAVETTIKVLPYRSGRWQAILSLKNNKRTSPVSGQVEISTGDKEELRTLLSGEKSTIRFNIPEGVVSGPQKLDVTVLLDDGNTVVESVETQMVCVTKTDTPPVIDGKLSFGEWKLAGQPIMLNQASQYIGSGWKGEEDLSGKIYLMYDDENLYYGAEVTDDIHCGTDEKNRTWAIDSIQLAVAEKLSAVSNYTELAIALNDAGESVITRYHAANQDTPFFVAADINVFKNTEIKVTREKNKTYYELKIPWSEITLSDKPPKSGELVFSTLINENDGKGRNSWLEWTPGIGNGKNPGLFGTLPLV